MATISQEVNFDILEKLTDGTYKKKNVSTKASQVEFEDGSTVEAHKADDVSHGIYTDTVQTNIKYKLVVIDEEPFLEVVEV